MTLRDQSRREDIQRGTEVVDIRHYGASDFALLLTAESRLWTEELHWDYAASARLISSCLDEKRLSGYALVKERRISGYCFFFYENDKALIGDLFVTSNGIRVGDARLLVEHVLETVLATPGLSRVEAQLPNFLSRISLQFFNRTALRPLTEGSCWFRYTGVHYRRQHRSLLILRSTIGTVALTSMLPGSSIKLTAAT